LLDIEYILILDIAGGLLSPSGAAVQIQDVNAGETSEQILSHPPVGQPIQIGVVGNKPQYSEASLFYTPLGKANELDIVIIKV